MGPSGGLDPAKVSYVDVPEVTIAPKSFGHSTATCPTGAKAISGGWLVRANDVGEVVDTRSFDSGGSWTVHVYNWHPTDNATVMPFAVCAAR